MTRAAGRALMRLPGPEITACQLGFLPREPIDIERALRQHAAYRTCLEELGMSVELLEALPGMPDAVFVEDLAVLLPDVTVIGRPGVSSREGEAEPLRRAVRAWRRGVPLVELSPGATLEGGDVLALDDVLWVGQSTRTNHAGLKQLAHSVLDLGLRVKSVSVHGCLHLRTAVSDLGDGILLLNPRWIESDRLAGHEWIEVHPSEPFGANGFRAGSTIVLSASAPRTAERVAARGLAVCTVEIGEFERAEGGPSCLSLREPALRPPGAQRSLPQVPA